MVRHLAGCRGAVRKGAVRYELGDGEGLGREWYRLRREPPESLWMQKASIPWLGKREAAR